MYQQLRKINFQSPKQNNNFKLSQNLLASKRFDQAKNKSFTFLSKYLKNKTLKAKG